MSAAASNTIVNAATAALPEFLASAAGNSITLTATDSTIIHVDLPKADSTLTSNKVGQLMLEKELQTHEKLILMLLF